MRSDRRASKGEDEPHYIVLATMDEGRAFRVYVNAAGKNARTTFFFPRNSDSFTSFPVVSLRVKSGALEPIAIGMGRVRG